MGDWPQHAVWWSTPDSYPLLKFLGSKVRGFSLGWTLDTLVKNTSELTTTGERVDRHPGQRRPISDAGDDVIAKSHVPNVWRHPVSHVTRVGGAKRRPGDFRISGHVDDQRRIWRQVDTLTVDYYWTATSWPGHVHTGAWVTGHVTSEPSDGWREESCVSCIARDSRSICNQSVVQWISRAPSSVGLRHYHLFYTYR